MRPYEPLFCFLDFGQFWAPKVISDIIIGFSRPKIVQKHTFFDMLWQQFLRYGPFYPSQRFVLKIICDLNFPFCPCASFPRSGSSGFARFCKLIVRTYEGANGQVRTPGSLCSRRYEGPKKAPKWPFWAILGPCSHI